MANPRTNLEKLSEKLPTLINTANDKLTIILGNAEMALLDLDESASSLLQKQLRTITALSEDIGVINGKLMGLVTNMTNTNEKEP